MTSFFFLLTFYFTHFFFKRQNDPNNQLIIFGDFRVGNHRFRGIYIPSFYSYVIFGEIVINATDRYL
jgi:hypothetical protein